MISYSAINGWGSGKTTLPSVETWGSSMNMLRDPPKSIYTRKIDRVGQTSEITQMIQDSGDRAAEAIQVYARGKNPMVAVDFSNNGNNGGQRGGSRNNVGLSYGNLNNSRQTYLPYRAMIDGAFYAPIRDQRTLLPLSRLPRVWTSSFSQPSFADFSKKAMCPAEIGDDYKGVKSADMVLKACARPTATYQIQTPVVETYEVKNVIKNPLQVPVSSGQRWTRRVNGEIGAPVKQIHDQLKTDININQKGERQKQVQIDNHNIERYTHDVLTGSFDSNRSQNVQVTPIDEIMHIDPSKNIQEFINIDYTAPQSSFAKYDLNDNISLERTTPYYDAYTNRNDRNIYKRMENQTVERAYTLNRPNTEAQTSHTTRSGGIDNISSRQYHLRPTINAGGFDGSAHAGKPTYDRENHLTDFDNDKSRMRQLVFDMQQARSVELGNIPYQPQ